MNILTVIDSSETNISDSETLQQSAVEPPMTGRASTSEG